jgi:hypothetical protein
MQAVKTTAFPRISGLRARGLAWALAAAALGAAALGASSVHATQEPAPPPTDCASLEAYHRAWLALVPTFPEGLEGTFGCWPDGAGGY